MTTGIKPGAQENVMNKGEGGGSPRGQEISPKELVKKGAMPLKAVSHNWQREIPKFKLKPLRVAAEVGDKGAGRGGEKGAGQGPERVGVIKTIQVKLEHGDQVVHPIHKGREPQNGEANTRATGEATEHPGDKVILQSKSTNHRRGGEEGGRRE